MSSDRRLHMPVTRYQEGSIDRVSRKKGPDVWMFRWRELVDGRRVQKKRIIGNLSQYPTLADAKRAIDPFRAQVNATKEVLGEMKFRELWGDFAKVELRRKLIVRKKVSDELVRSETTIELYECNARAHLIPRWGETYLSQIFPDEVELWLESLDLANPTKSKLRNMMSLLFSHAIRRRFWKGANPIETVRQSAEREKTPDKLSLPEIEQILRRIESPMLRTAILVAATTGFRVSEIRGLKWSDVDIQGLFLHVRRGVVRSHVTRAKTKASRSAVPIPQGLADALTAWRGRALYRGDEDWVFASEIKKGRVPVWLDRLCPKVIQPAADAASIRKRIGWHTFRRSLASLLVAKKEDVKTTQELLRHADVNVTLQLYAQGDEDTKRSAQAHVAGLFQIGTVS
jgi:integrase